VGLFHFTYTTYINYQCPAQYIHVVYWINAVQNMQDNYQHIPVISE